MSIDGLLSRKGITAGDAVMVRIGEGLGEETVNGVGEGEACSEVGVAV